MADKTILTQKLIDLEGLSVFWGKTKDYIDGKITAVNDVIEENEKTTSEALNDLNTKTSNNAAAISSIQQELESLSGGAGSIATQINTALEPYKVKTVDTTATNGINLSLGDDAKVKVNVTPGSVAENDGSVVTGGAVYTAVNAVKSGSTITIEATGDNTSDVKKYEFKQGGELIGTINLPKDLVIASGKVAICAVEGDNFGKKCLELTLTSGDTVHIPVDELVDVYTGGDYVTISDTNVITVDKAGIIDGLAKTADVYTKTDADLTFVSKTGYVAYSDAEKTKLAGIAEGAQVNVIESVVVNGVTATITGKTASVDVDCYTKNEVDTKLSAKANAADVYTKTEADGKFDAAGDAAQALIDAKAYTDELGKIVKGVYQDGKLTTDGHAQRIKALEDVAIASDEDIIKIFA